MKYTVPVTLVAGMAATIALFSLAGTAQAADEAAAKATARQSDCFRCHTVDPGKKEKDGPTWRSVGIKYKDKDPAESVNRLTTHITSGEKAKFPDGHEEEHKIIKTDDKAEIKNLVDWILSLR